MVEKRKVWCDVKALVLKVSKPMIPIMKGYVSNERVLSVIRGCVKSSYVMSCHVTYLVPAMVWMMAEEIAQIVTIEGTSPLPLQVF